MTWRRDGKRVVNDELGVSVVARGALADQNLFGFYVVTREGNGQFGCEIQRSGYDVVFDQHPDGRVETTTYVLGEKPLSRVRFKGPWKGIHDEAAKSLDRDLVVEALANFCAFEKPPGVTIRFTAGREGTDPDYREIILDGRSETIATA